MCVWALSLFYAFVWIEQLKHSDDIIECIGMEFNSSCKFN